MWVCHAFEYGIQFHSRCYADTALIEEDPANFQSSLFPTTGKPICRLDEADPEIFQLV